MENEKIYFHPNAYMNIMGFWTNVSNVIVAVTNMAVDGYDHKEEGIVLEGIPYKTYSYDYNNNHQMTIGDKTADGRQLIFECSDGRRLAIEFANMVTMHSPFDYENRAYIRFTYNKKGEENIEFNMSYDNEDRRRDDKLNNICAHVKYKDMEFKDNLFVEYLKLARSGKSEEARKCMQVHKEIVNKLMYCVFDYKELVFMRDKLIEINKKDVHDLIKNQSREKLEKRIYRTLADYDHGISR